LNNGQTIWDKKMTCYWELLKEYIENLGNILGTTWELVGNIMKTHWEQKNKKKTLPPQNQKEKN
jgi:hypothetical protein